jgi:hypothetical protein
MRHFTHLPGEAQSTCWWLLPGFRSSVRQSGVCGTFGLASRCARRTPNLSHVLSRHYSERQPRSAVRREVRPEHRFGKGVACPRWLSPSPSAHSPHFIFPFRVTPVTGVSGTGNTWRWIISCRSVVLDGAFGYGASPAKAASRCRLPPHSQTFASSAAVLDCAGRASLRAATALSGMERPPPKRRRALACHTVVVVLVLD